MIKVQYGNTLRRFNARINENGNLDLDLLGLTTKISSLFSIPLEAELTLTYSDEDGDIVTLADDDDLSDVMKQRLKFLKVFVSVKDDRNTGSYSRSSGSSTPLRSPRVQQPLPNINAVISDAMKSVPEPLREALSRLSHEFVSKAAISTPNIADAIEQLTRVGQSFMNPAPQPPPANVSGENRSTSVDPSFKKPEAEIVSSAATTSNVVPATQTLVSSEIRIAEHTVSEDQIPDLNAGNGPLRNKEKECTSEAAPALAHLPRPLIPFVVSRCPFSGEAVGNEFGSSDSPHWPKRGHKHLGATGSIFHRGIRCDGCGVYPIVGDRHKSLVKEDYDLCSVCFNVTGKAADYIRIEKPVSQREAFSSQHHPWYPVPLAHRVKHCGVKRGLPKLDSRFVSDVTIADGTIMAPSTPFMKIWRMRNNGNFIWTQGMKLVWIGGDRFDERDSIEIEIPSEGIAVDAELNIAVDFTSPSAPGRYLSYWRMSSPSGQKFGQRVWLLVLVDASLADEFEGLDLNIPVVSSSQSAPDSRGPEEHNFPTTDELLVGNESSSPEYCSPPVLYPVVDTSVPSAPAPASTDLVEASLLKELESMGFKQIDLNKEVLRTNGYNLEQSVDELCGVAEWDPILEELHEMGFCDHEMNKKLLKKNGGSIKGVVMDLLTGDRTTA